MTPALFVAAASGLLLSLSFPPAGLDLVAWVALVPFLWAINAAPRPLTASLYGAVYGLTFFLLDLRWVFHTLTIHGHFSAAPAVLLLVCMVVTLSVLPAAFAFLVAVFSRGGWPSAVTAPFLWTGLEYFRAIALGGFPWDLTGYSQAQRLILVQIADVTGVYGLSFLVVLVNAAIWEVMRRLARGEDFPWKLVLTACVTVALVLGYGNNRLNRFQQRPDGGSGCGVALLQANIPQEMKWAEGERDRTFAAYEKLGARAVREGARLLVWPETSVPVIFGPSNFGWKRPVEISARLGVPMLVGAPSERVEHGKSHYYNSAFLMDGLSLRDRYDKMHLVPFGEYMPLSSILPLGPGIAAREADYTPGENMTVMSLDGCSPFSVLICYEAIFPEISRIAVRNGAQMLINITNDGWFGLTAAPYQHLNMARLRSIENRVWLTRCANTGISAAFDQAGRMVGNIPLNKEGILVVKTPVSVDVGSFYCTFGDLFAWGCIATVLVIALLTGSSRKDGYRIPSGRSARRGKGGEK